MPPPHLVSGNHRLLTSLSATQLQEMYKQAAFDVDAPVYIYNGKRHHSSSEPNQGDAAS
jgi:hypothetical protein